jgi:hypothetical protein
MASTYFIDNTTPIVSAWLNDVNNFVYQGKQRGVVTATSGQTVFTVPFTYTVNGNTLNVYIDGIHQTLGSSYTETSSTSVTFSEGLHVGAKVEFVG